MGRIQSSIGLITGTNINQTVDQLIAISARPRDRLKTRINGLKEQQKGIEQLTVQVVGMQLAGKRLADPNLFNTTKVTSDKPDSITVTKRGTPTAGKHFARVLQVAQTHTVGSSSVSRPTAILDKNGFLEIRGGGFVDESQLLDTLNQGIGVQGGAIRITDRSGASALIDLRGARSVEDVLTTINRSTGIRVRAATDGDRFVLTDLSGGAGQLRVDEVGSSTTARDLGFANATTSSSTLQGHDVFGLSPATKLSSLNDGLGVTLDPNGSDLRVGFRDGTHLEIDFGDFSRPASNARGTTNAADVNARLTVQATATGGADDGVAIVIVDDPSIAAGSESVELIESSQGKQLVFRADVGATTADHLRQALSGNSVLSARFTASTHGTGAGLVSTTDTGILSGGAAREAPASPTLQHVLSKLNSIDPAKLAARIASSGDHIELIDLTSGASALTVSNLGESRFVEDFGLTEPAISGTITSTRLLTGLRSVSLNRLASVGTAPLTSINVQLRDGTGPTTIDLSAAKSLQDVLNIINQSGLAIEATYNEAGTGLSLRDLTGGTSASFSVSSSDDTAARLGLNGTSNDAVLEGKGLGRRFISLNTELKTLNQGSGIPFGSFSITDSNGVSATVNLETLKPKTVGDVIRKINTLGLALTARINQAGDGIELVDHGEGPITQRVTDLNNGAAAKGLRIAGSAERRIVDGNVRQINDGSQVDRIFFSASDSLATLVSKVNELSSLATATISEQGTGSRLQFVSQRGGGAGRIAVSSADLGLTFKTTQRGQDGLLAVGDSANGGNPQIHRSQDGVFTEAIAGLSITANAVTESSVKITVDQDNEAVVTAINLIVDQYNKIHQLVGQLTFFDAQKNSTGILFGSGEVLRVTQGLSRTFTSPYAVPGSLKSLQSIGVSFDQQGKLLFSSSKLREQLETRPDDVKELLSNPTRGFQKRLDTVTEQLAGVKNSTLINKNESLNKLIDNSNARVDTMNLRLEAERNRLLNQFFAMETAIGRIQANQSAINSISAVAALSSFFTSRDR